METMDTTTQRAIRDDLIQLVGKLRAHREEMMLDAFEVAHFVSDPRSGMAEDFEGAMLRLLDRTNELRWRIEELEGLAEGDPSALAYRRAREATA